MFWHGRGTKEDEVVNPVPGRADVVGSENRHYGVCNAAEDEASAGSTKGGDVVDVT